MKLESVLAERLRSAASDQKYTLAADALAKCAARLETEVADLLAGELIRPAAGLDRATLLAWAQALPPSPTAAYLFARIATEIPNLPAAAEAWELLFRLHPARDPFHLLAYSRILNDLARPDEAVLALRRALSQPVKYAFFSRADKLVQRLTMQSATYLRECRIAVLGASTTNLLMPVLKALALRDRIRAEFYEGLYGSMTQEILDPASGLARFQPNIVFLASNWRELQLPPVSDDEPAVVARALEERAGLWEKLGSQGAHVVQFAYDFPPHEPHGYLARSLEGGRARVVERINHRMVESAPSYVSILDTPELQRQAGAGWFDANLWYNFQQHPSSEALPTLAEAMMAHCRAVVGLTRKVLITDLDNTLWKGVIGEDGLDGIKVGPGSPAGEAHLRLQQYLLDLKARGILLAVSSKNNYDDAAQPFQKHPHMLLRMEDFAAFEANWNDKATSIREIARKLSLGLDSFVFIDDNPIEREWVRSQIPEVDVIELGSSVFHYVNDLDRGRPFYAVSLSAEDRLRAEQYRGEAARKHIQASAQSLDEFLSQLQLRASCQRVSAPNLARVTQLTNKTNQFNLTTRRYTEAQVSQLSERPDAWTAAFHLADRMGDYGLIGVIFCVPGADSTDWEIDTWLMSCRVLGRQMEKYMFDRLVEAARARGIRQIFGLYKPTAKNGLVRDHYPQLGFELAAESPAETRYRLTVPDHPTVTATHIQSNSGC